MRVARVSLAILLTVSSVWSTACQTGTPTMSLEEAKAITASFAAQDFAPPPRTIKDVRSLLRLALDPYRVEGDLSPPSGQTDSATLARFHLARGRAARRMGRIRQAIDDLTRAAEYGKPGQATLPGAFTRPESGNFVRAIEPDLGRVILQDLADTYAAAGNYWQAIATYEKAISAVSLAPIDRGRNVFMTADLVALYASTGDLKAAERELRELLRIEAEARSILWGGGGQERQAAYTARGQAVVAKAQASVLDARGRLTEAETLWRKAIDLLTPFEYHEFWAAVIDASRGRLALCLVRQGRMLEAEAEARSALRSALNRHDSYSFDTGALITGLARILREQGRYADAQVLAKEAIRRYEQGGASPRSSPTVTAPYRELAAALVAQGQWEAALSEYEVFRQRLADDRLYGRLMDDEPALAVALLRTGRGAEASEAVGTALARSQRLRGDRHPATAELRGLLAVALAAREDTPAALANFSSAVTVLLERDRSTETQDDTTSRGEREQRLVWILSSYINVLSRIPPRTMLPGGIDPAAEAFRLADVARGRVVQRAIDATAARSAVKTPALADLVRREQDAEAQIGALHGLVTAAFDAEKLHVVSDLRQRIDSLQKARKVLTGQIAKEFPSYAQLVNPAPVTLEQARAALRPGEALIATLVTEERTYVWAGTRDGPLVFAGPAIGENKLAEVVGSLRKALDTRAETLGNIPAFDVNAAHDLYRMLLDPVKDGWQSADTLLVVGHGPLAQLPLGLLTTKATTLEPERPPLFSTYRNVPWLARRYAIATLPSVSALTTLRATPALGASHRRFAGFGDPYFTEAQAREADGETPVSVNTAAVRTDVEVRSVPVRFRDVIVSPGKDVETSRIAMLPRLPDTRDEILSIARIMGADLERDVFLGRAANEHTVKTADLAQYRVIAFATHGLVPGDLDGLMQPALALTAPEVAKIKGDGLLTMEEILGLRLDADWVVLSACNTANGNGTGSVALSGLGRAFFYAGARALLVTQWPVETRAARMLTTELFRRQSAEPGVARAKVLQATTNWMIDEGGLVDPETSKTVFSFAHPIFWAPFALVGEP